MILNNRYLKTTHLTSSTKTLFFMQKRYNPGGGKGGKTIVEIAVNTTKKGLDKCIGAGCMFETNAANIKPTSTPISSSQKITASNNNSKDYSTQVNKEQHHAQKVLNKKMSEDVKSLEEKYIPKKTNNNSTENSNITQNNPTNHFQDDFKNQSTNNNNIKQNVTQAINEDQITPNNEALKKHQALQKKLNEELKQVHDYSNNKDDNVKPSSFKNMHGKDYSTTITENTVINDISEEQLLDDMLNRGLIKVGTDNEFEVVPILLKNGEEYLLNNSKHNTKLTQVGQAYYAQQAIKKDQTMPKKEHQKFNSDNLYIIVPPKASNDLFIETGKQKHLLVAFDTNTGDYYALGFFTSKSSGKLVSETQYKAYEKMQEASIQDHKHKKQYIAFFNYINKLSPEDIKIVKYSEAYLSEIAEEIIEQLKKEAEIKVQQKIIYYDTHGLTKQDGLNMCKEHDKIVAIKKNNPNAKVQHPLSLEQKKKNEDNEMKQKTDNHNILKNSTDEIF